MSYRNDPYDPKQAALLAPEALEGAVADAEKAFAAAADLDALFALKPAHLGDRSPVSLARREIGSLPPAAKSDAGKRVNVARQAVQAAYDARQAELEADRAARVLVEERVDVTLPWSRRPRGARHPLTTLMEHMGDIFIGMGYEIVDGPQLELEWANFDALNIGPDNPVRGASDTFFVDLPGLVMRTHTSPGQVRTMLDRQPPIYVVSPGRVYRTDELDATHSPVFHQIEGLVIDEGITMAHLRGTLDHFAKALFGVWFPQHRDGPRWVEWGGCGMVNPRVLTACGIDPARYSGFAFGMGVERTLMFRNGVSDMRDMVEGDVRFTTNFGMES
jgi:phenylalanyl-tRNA synthetase alpha chain